MRLLLATGGSPTPYSIEHPGLCSPWDRARTLVLAASEGHRLYDKQPCKMASISRATATWPRKGLPPDERGTDPDRGRRRYDEHKGRRLRKERQGTRRGQLADSDPLPWAGQGPPRPRRAVGLLRGGLAPGHAEARRSRPRGEHSHRQHG